MLHANLILESEISHKGPASYEKLKATLEPQNVGQVVAIHPDSGAYVVAKTRLEAVRKLKKEQPSGPMFVTRIGPPTSADLSVIERMSSVSK